MSRIQPELINSDPYGAGWILDLDVESTGQMGGLLDAAAYARHVSDS